MPRTLQQTLDDPEFRKLKPETQKAVLTKMKVSSGMQDKLLAKIAAPATATSAPATLPASVPPFFQRAKQRAGSQIKGTLVDLPEQAIKDLSSGKAFGPASWENVEKGLGGVPRMFSDWFRDPANIVGDVVAGSVLGVGEAGKRGASAAKVLERTEAERSVSSPPAAPRVVPEELRNLSPEQRLDYIKKVGEARKKHAEDLAEYHKNVERAHDKANNEHAEALRQHAADEAERARVHAEKVEGAKKSEADNVAALKWKEVLENGSREYTKQAHNNIRETHAVVRGRLNQRGNAIRSEMGTTVVAEPGDIWNGIKSAESEYLHNSPPEVQQFRNLIRELGIKDFIENEDGTLEPAPDAGKPLTWEPAHTHYSAIGNRLASGGLAGNVWHALNSVQDLIGDRMSRTAEAAGRGAEWESFKRDWSQYMRDWQDKRAVEGSPLARALPSPDPGYVLVQAVGRAGDRMLDILGRYTDQGARPDLLRMARQLRKESREIKPPRVKEAPGKFAAKAPPMLEPPKLPKEPKPPGAVPVPAPEGKTGALPRAFMRAGGHVGGGLAAQAAGIPWWYGSATGGALSEAAIRIIERRRANAARAGVPPDLLPYVTDLEP